MNKPDNNTNKGKAQPVFASLDSILGISAEMTAARENTKYTNALCQAAKQEPKYAGVYMKNALGLPYEQTKKE